MIALSLNPVIGLPEALSLALVFFVIALWLALRASSEARAGIRAALIFFRTLGLAALAFVWLNPGQWIDESNDTRRDWLVLLDRSSSMKAEHSPGKLRWQTGADAAAKLQRASGEKGAVRVRTFSTQLEDETADANLLAPDGTGTDISRAVTTALDQRATPLAGIIVVSDGRATSRARMDELALRARGRGVTVHAVPLAGDWGGRDLALTAMPRQITAFKGQPVKITAMLDNRGLGNVKPSVALLDPDGKEIARKDIALTEGARASVTFELPTVPEAGADFTLRTDPWPGEHVPNNNSDHVRVNVLTTKTRVLLLEGAPYWDSKFLAQLLRQQSAIDILTVHRLNEERYFRVEATGAEPLQSPDSVFPRTAAELSRYDLIVFGKGADGFLDPARAAALQGFVRDQGGAVLFARGKPYGGRFAPLEALEPVEWGEDAGISAKFTPLADTGAGLFGAALPPADDRVWPTLPPLDDVRTITRLKPFARVLAEGAFEGRQTRVPLLVARRFGRGMVAAVNADGLWRWDFRPEVREQGAVYQQFWVQLMQWCATYSEFRPGEDYAVRLAEPSTEPGRSVRATIAWRGPALPEPHPVLKITRNGQPAGEAVGAPLPASDAGREWAAVVSAAEPGRYEIRVSDAGRPGKLEGQATLLVLAPPAESDDLRPDPEALATLARDSGGKVWKLEELDQLAKQLWQLDASAVRGKPRWDPLWSRWYFALLLTLTFGAEWWLRRREGML